MRLIMVRHGEPDYVKDCLTENGRYQAKAVAGRLMAENIQAVYSSPMGRARETAAYTAHLLELPVTVLDFMHEITWGGSGIPEEGHPWTLSDRMIIAENFDFSTDDWRNHPYYAGNAATACFDEVSRQFDSFLENQGYIHEGRRFFCVKNISRTIALFSHGGSGACVLSHMLSLPFPYVITVMPYDFTSVIVLNFPNKPGSYVYPRLELFNDVTHLVQSNSFSAGAWHPDR